MHLNRIRVVVLLTAIITFILPGLSAANENNLQSSIGDEGLVYSGFFSREENDGKMAKLSGKSHYLKFFPPNRVIRLFIPYPYSKTVKNDAIASVFEIVSKKTKGDAYIRGKFDLMDKDVIADLGTVKIGEKASTGQKVVMFDCELSSPCRIEFTDSGLNIIKKGILADHVILYDYINQ